MEANSHNFKNLVSFKTDLNADSVEWCPHFPNENVFVCGNYQLEENEVEPKRLGKVSLFSYSKEDLKLHQIQDISGVLDQKWCHSKIESHSILGVASATGQIIIYKLNANISLELLCSNNVTNCDTLILSLDWSTGKYSSTEPNIVCSDSKGDIHLLKLTNSNLELIEHYEGHSNSWKGLSFEAWVVGFYYWDNNLFFSGGDDGAFLMYDLRVKKKWVSKNNSHEAGVTSFHSNNANEHILATGSYDQHIRIWDIRNLRKEINKIKMPGEVWRLKWDPFKRNMLLAACMYNGVHVVDLSVFTDSKIVGSFYEHKNISYGIDWSYLNKTTHTDIAEDDYIIASCSFYDKLLCISKFSNVT